jgi:hypothetical protein
MNETTYTQAVNKIAGDFMKIRKIELALIRAEMASITQDYAELNAELLAEREVRTNAQNERDDLARRIVQCDAGCTSDDWVRLVEMARRVCDLPPEKSVAGRLSGLDAAVPADAQEGLETHA